MTCDTCDLIVKSVCDTRASLLNGICVQITSQHGTNVNIRIEHRLPQDVTANAIAYVNIRVSYSFCFVH